MTTSTAQILSDRLRELRFAEELFRSEDTAKLMAVVEKERAALETDFEVKFKARVAKLLTCAAVGKIISGAAFADNGGRQ